MAEDTQEGLVPKDVPAEIVARAVLTAVRLSGGAAIVNVGEISTDQNEIIEKLPPGYQHVTVQKILDGKTEPLTGGLIGLVVTGYTSDLYDNHPNETEVQDYVRSNAIGGLKVIVVTSSLPNENIFDVSLPWYNGPFDERSVWSITTSGKPNADFQIVNHKLEREVVKDPKPHWNNHWAEGRRVGV